MGTTVVHQSKPATIEHVDMAPSVMPINAMYNDFLVRLEYMRGKNPDWTDPKNQNRPFKPHFLEFIRTLVTRFPVTPEILPTQEGNVIFKFRKKKAPKDKWQVLEFTITPQRRFSMVVRSRISSQAPFTKINLARPDYMSDIIQKFFELDSVDAKEHPVRYRAATSIDMPYISAIFTTQFGPSADWSPRNIGKVLQYCVVADDPLYGIVSVAAFRKTEKSGDFSNLAFEVAGVYTIQPLRGLGIGGKCLRKSLTDLLADQRRPGDVEIIARVPLMAGTQRDNCRGLLSRSGFKRTKVVRGERRFLKFHCDLCDTERCACVPDSTESMCSTVYYRLNDKGGSAGYGGGKCSSN